MKPIAHNGARRSLLGSLLAATALCSAAVAETPPAPVVTLAASDSSVRIEGELLSFENGAYRLRTAIGEISVPLDGLICTGAACPSPDAVARANPARGIPGEPVILSAAGGALRMAGRLVAYKGDRYVIDTPLGALEVRAEGTLCEGPGCPTGAVPVTAELRVAAVTPSAPGSQPAAITIAGSEDVVSKVLPALAADFAEARGARLEPASAELRAAAGGAGDDGLKLMLTSLGGRTMLDGRYTEYSGADPSTGSGAMADITFVAAPAHGMPDATAIGAEALVGIVAQGNPTEGLTEAQLAGIFSGQITSWAQLGGPEVPIRVVGLPPRHEITAALERTLLAPRALSPRKPDVVVSDATALAATVAADPAAIGFTGRSAIGAARDLALASACAGFVRATPDAVLTGRYPLKRDILALPRGGASGEAKVLLAHLGGSADAIMHDAGMIGAGLARFPLEAEREAVAEALSSESDPARRQLLSDAARIMPMAERLGTVIRPPRPGEAPDDATLATLSRLTDYAARHGLGELFLVGYASTGQGAEADRAAARDLAREASALLEAADTGGRLQATLLRTVGLGDLGPGGCEDASEARVEVWVRR